MSGWLCQRCIREEDVDVNVRYRAMKSLIGSVLEREPDLGVLLSLVPADADTTEDGIRALLRMLAVERGDDEAEAEATAEAMAVEPAPEVNAELAELVVALAAAGGEDPALIGRLSAFIKARRDGTISSSCDYQLLHRLIISSHHTTPSGGPGRGRQRGACDAASGGAGRCAHGASAREPARVAWRRAGRRSRRGGERGRGGRGRGGGGGDGAGAGEPAPAAGRREAPAHGHHAAAQGHAGQRGERVGGRRRAAARRCQGPARRGIARPGTSSSTAPQW
jgi:hypothetical protein